jgi:hypothetical protein
LPSISLTHLLSILDSAIFLKASDTFHRFPFNVSQSIRTRPPPFDNENDTPIFNYTVKT